MTRPLILVTNDDGYRAPGIRALAEALGELGDVLVVAPDGPQSAVSQTITLHKPLRMWSVTDGWIACSGTPTDCVYLGIHAICKQRKPDVVVSGINRGPNLGQDVFYSGTVAGAMEGRLLGYPALAISQLMSMRDEFQADGEPATVDYRPAAQLASRITAQILARGMPQDVLFNVNVPTPYDPDDGVRVVPLGRRLYGESYAQRQDPRGKDYFWIGGSDVDFEPIPDTDCTVVAAGHATLTPVRTNLTHDGLLDELAHWRFPGVPSDGG